MPGKALACSCGMQDFQEAFDTAGAVFQGTVTTITPINQQLGTSICTRTAPLSLASADLSQLGQGSAPVQTDLLSFVLDNLLAVIAGIAAIVIVIIVYLLRRKRGRSYRLRP